MNCFSYIIDCTLDVPKIEVDASSSSRTSGVDLTNGHFFAPNFRGRILNIDKPERSMDISRIPRDFVPLFSTSRRRVRSHFVLPKRVEASGTHRRRTPVQHLYSGHASRPLVLGHYLPRSFRRVLPRANFSLGRRVRAEVFETPPLRSNFCLSNFEDHASKCVDMQDSIV